jgi:hypothetical protein
MNTQSLNHVTLETLKNYRTAATQAMVAYRLGGHRLVRAINRVLANNVYPRTAQLAPRATVRLDEVRGSISAVVAKGIDEIADRTAKVIASGSTAAAAQLNQASRFAAGIDNPIVANGLQAAARLTMPGANVALVVSSKVAEGASALASAAGARPVRHAVRKTAAGVKRKAAPVVRKAKAVGRKAAKRVA